MKQASASWRAGAVPAASAARTRPPPTAASAWRKARSSATRRPALVSSTLGKWFSVCGAARRRRPRSGPEELGHGGVAGRADALAPGDGDERPPQDPEIDPEAPVVDVPDIERE